MTNAQPDAIRILRARFTLQETETEADGLVLLGLNRPVLRGQASISSGLQRLPMPCLATSHWENASILILWLCCLAGIVLCFVY
jgi:hypothetical protein